MEVFRSLEGLPNNGKVPLLNECTFGLTNNEGNDGEDVKEYHFYLDSTPTHSYMTDSVAAD
jgi:hypothetical protein